MNNNFLDKKYPNLQREKEVERAVKSTGKNLYDKDEKIEVYLARLEKLVLDPKKDQNRINLEDSPRPRALFLLREKILNKYVRSNLEKKTEGAVRVEERAARNLGMGDLNYEGEQINQRQEILIKDLEKSLDAWISYLSDNNEPYPMWFRYYVFRNILNLGEYDKDKGEFKERSSGSAGLFPEIDRGALAYIQDVIEAIKDKNILSKLQEAQKIASNNNLKEGELLTKEKAENFSKMSFAKQYKEAIKLNGEITPEMREETKGKWVKYQQNTDPTALWMSLQNKGTAWCTKGFATASTQLKGGDFYVYYTLDKTGEPKIPRIAIRMNGQEEIGEVRGVLDSDQNLEGNMVSILEEKFKEFGTEGDKYKKKSEDMQKMTLLFKKQENKEIFSKDELKFIYQIDYKIDGFGYKDDPRIIEILLKRNYVEDADIIFDNKIATNINEIKEDTVAYIGEIPNQKNIYKKFINLNLEYIYTNFPDKKIEIFNVKNMEYPTNAKEWKRVLDKKNVYQENGTEKMLELMKKTSLPENQKFIKLTVVEDLFGDTSSHTYQEICNKAKELGLTLCEQDDGPKLRLSYNQKKGDWFRTAMEAIRMVDAFRIWHVDRYSGEQNLHWHNGDPDRIWGCNDRFVFRLSK